MTCAKSLATEPDDRYDSAAELASEAGALPFLLSSHPGFDALRSNIEFRKFEQQAAARIR